MATKEKEAAPAGALAKTTDKPTTLQGWLKDANVKERFEQMLGKEAPAFLSSLVSVTNGSDYLKKCSPLSIIGAAAQAAAMHLPIAPGLGQAYIVPYDDVAQFQIGWKGFVQLAHRSQQYRAIRVAPVYEGQLVGYDEHRGTIKLDADAKRSEKVYGFFFRFELLTGFVHEAYWSASRCVAHGKKFSKAFQAGKGPWTEDPALKKFEGWLTYDSGTYKMSLKTVIKNELSNNGPLDITLARAIAADQAAFTTPDGKPEYIDGTAVETENAAAEARVPMPEGAKAKHPTRKNPEMARLIESFAAKFVRDGAA